MTREQYLKGISTLSSKQIEVLKAIYYAPNNSCTTKELAKLLNYKSYHGANRQVGAIGKRFSEIKGVKVKIYIDNNQERPAYFELIGPYIKNGWRMHSELCKTLEFLGVVSSDKSAGEYEDRLPTEFYDFETKLLLKEGKAIQVTVNKYERNSRARQKCIQHHGLICKICGFDYQTVYGKIAEGFIQVHHIKPLSEINKQYKIDPINDLIPICANCHSVIHLTKPAMKIEEIKKLIKKAATNTVQAPLPGEGSK